MSSRLTFSSSSTDLHEFEAKFLAPFEINYNYINEVAFRHAVKTGDETTVAAYCRSDTTIDCTDDVKTTPLMLSVIGSHVSITKKLLDFKVDLSQVDSEGRTALMHAVKQKSIESVKLLLKDRDPEAKATISEIKSLDIAVTDPSIEIISVLLENINFPVSKLKEVFEKLSSTDLSSTRQEAMSIFLKKLQGQWEEKTVSLDKITALLTFQEACKDFVEKYPKNYFECYPFSNEYDFGRTIQILSTLQPSAREAGSLNVAFLVSESKILSLLPELVEQGIDLVIMNDVNALLRKHTRFLVHCLYQASSPDEFKKLYIINNPLRPQVEEKERAKTLLGDLENAHYEKTKGSDKFFLNSPERFQQCKAALKKLAFSWCTLDLFEKEPAIEFEKMLRDNNMIIRIMNITNVHQYDSFEGRMKDVLDILLARSRSPIILYSLGMSDAKCHLFLCSKIGRGKKVYHHLLEELREARTEEDDDHFTSSSYTSEKEAKKLVDFYNDQVRPILKNKYGILNDRLLPVIKIEEMLSRYKIVMALPDCKDDEEGPQAIEASKKLFRHLLQAISPWRYLRYLRPEEISELAEKKECFLDYSKALKHLKSIVEAHKAHPIVHVKGPSFRFGS